MGIGKRFDNSSCFGNHAVLHGPGIRHLLAELRRAPDERICDNPRRRCEAILTPSGKTPAVEATRKGHTPCRHLVPLWVGPLLVVPAASCTRRTCHPPHPSRHKRLCRWFTCPSDKLGESERRLAGVAMAVSPPWEAYALLQDCKGFLRGEGRYLSRPSGPRPFP